MELFDLSYIQGLINEEYADYSIYKNESKLFQDKVVNGTDISLIFNEFAKDELKHIARINKFFGVSLKPQARIIPSIKSLKENLQMHLERELNAINIYKVILTKSVKNSFDLKLIREILREEEKHYFIIKKYMNSIE